MNTCITLEMSKSLLIAALLLITHSIHHYIVVMLIIDTADAFIISQLFEQLFTKHNMIKICTINLSPHKLYENGLHYDYIIPFLLIFYINIVLCILWMLMIHCYIVMMIIMLQQIMV